MVATIERIPEIVGLGGGGEGKTPSEVLRLGMKSARRSCDAQMRLGRRRVGWGGEQPEVAPVESTEVASSSHHRGYSSNGA